MEENIFCKNCGKELPPESSFCPYCMTKFTKETVIEPDLKKKSGKKLLLSVALIVLIAAVAVAVLPKMLKDSESSQNAFFEETLKSSDSYSKTETDTSASQNETHSIESENAEETKILFEADTETGFSGYSNKKGLSREAALVASFFASDCMRVPYDTLKSTDIYVNTSIKFDCVVIEKAKDYIIVEYGATAGFDGIYEPTGDAAAVKLSDVSSVNESDSLTFYAEYLGTDSFKLYGKSTEMPVFFAERYTDYVYTDVEMPLFTKEEITSIAHTVFGSKAVVRDAKNSDFASSIGDVEMNKGMFYTAQVGSSKYCFYTGESRFIYDCGSTFSDEAYILPTADMNGYYRLISYGNEGKSSVECYGKNQVKLWQRDFKGSDLPAIDYTEKYVYLVSNANLYILDAKTGENVIRQKYVGNKYDMRKTGDGILLLSFDRSEALMKTDLSGNVEWTAQVSFNLSDSMYGTVSPVWQTVNNNSFVQCEAYDGNGFSIGTYTAVISNDGKIIFEYK
ncbi:MAG: zinc ribbon domain-containing protein [Clostridia bacterium]|nr:zinc ribbon domain-containing protein [Clostridia bacterium]